MKIELNINESPTWIPNLNHHRWTATAIVNGIEVATALEPLQVFALAGTDIREIASRFVKAAVLNDRHAPRDRV